MKGRPMTRSPSLLAPLLLAALVALAGCGRGPTPSAPAAPASVADYDDPPPGIANRLRIAEHRRERGDLAGALGSVDAALARWPESGAARVARAGILGELAARDGDDALGAEAEGIVEQERAAHPDAATPRVALARLRLDAGDPAGAHALLEGVLAERPDLSIARVADARALLGLGRLHEALDAAEGALASAPGSAAALAARGSARAALGRDREAEADLRAARRLRPGDARLAAQLAGVQLRRRQPARARDTLQAIPEAHRTAESERLLGDALRRVGDAPGAEAAYRRGVERAPSDVSLVGGLVDLLLEGGDAEAALAAIDGSRLEEAEAERLRFRCLEAAGDAEAARATLRRALEAEEPPLPAWGDAARLLEGDEGTALERSRAFFGREDGARVELLRGLLAKDDAEARSAYEAALAADPRLVVARNNLAFQLLRADQEPARALELAREAHEQAPLEPTILDTRSLALLRSGEPGEALRAAEVGLGLAAPGGATARSLTLHLALAREASGDLAGARRAAQTLVRAYRKGREPAEDPSWLAEARALLERTGIDDDA